MATICRLVRASVEAGIPPWISVVFWDGDSRPDVTHIEDYLAAAKRGDKAGMLAAVDRIDWSDTRLCVNIASPPILPELS